jgi:PKD repeat protein
VNFPSALRPLAAAFLTCLFVQIASPALAQDATSPSALSATVASCSHIDLDWAPPADAGGLQAYKVYRNGHFVAQIAAPVTSASQTALAASTDYSFAVSAVDDAGNESPPSEAVITATPACPDRAAPATPTGLAAATSASCSRIDLAWNAARDAGGSGLLAYLVYRDGLLVTVVLAPSTFVAETGLEPATTYTYTVVSLDYAGNRSAPSLPVSASTPTCSDVTPPSIPTGLTASVAGCQQVDVAWTAPPDTDVAGYYVYRNGLFFTQVPAPLTSISDVSVAPATVYSYGVAAFDSSGNASLPGSPVSVTTAACSDTSPPSAPTGLTASASTCNQINLAWGPSADDGGSGVAQYVVYRDGLFLKQVPAAVTSTTDGGLAASVAHSYSVVAVDGAGNYSAPSAVASASTPPCANRPPVAAAGPDQRTQTLITLSFSGAGSSDPDGTIVGYAWTFGDGTAASGVAAAHAYSHPGTYTVTLTVTDSGGLTARDTATVTAINRPPVANAGPDRALLAGQSTTFDASGSSDPDGKIVSYAWSFGDGASVSGITVNHAYTLPGTYTATLTVTDDAVATASDAAQVTVTVATTNGAGPWMQHFGDAGYDEARAVAIDRSGNVVVTGLNSGTIDLGGKTCSATIFVAKYTPAGDLLWAQCVGGAGGGSGRGLAVDPRGNVIVTGYFRGTVDFGTGPLTSAGGYDEFLAKYSPEGAPLWARSFGSSGASALPTEGGLSVATDAGGNVVVTGLFEDTVDFGTGPLTSAGGTDIFVARYSAAGDPLWAKRFGGPYGDQGNGVAIDARGNVVVTGTYLTTVDFGGGPLASAGYDGFVATFSAAGDPLWSQHFGGLLADAGNAVAVDASGNVLVTGVFMNTVDFGTGPLISAGGNDIFLVKYSAAGVPLWARRFGGASMNDSGNALATDASGNVVLAGSFARTVDFGTGPLTGAGGTDPFVALFSPDGTTRWAQRFGGTSIDEGRGVAVDAAGSVVLWGVFIGTVDFGGGPVTSVGGSDLFLVRLTPAP